MAPTTELNPAISFGVSTYGSAPVNACAAFSTGAVRAETCVHLGRKVFFVPEGMAVSPWPIRRIRTRRAECTAGRCAGRCYRLVKKRQCSVSLVVRGSMKSVMCHSAVGQSDSFAWLLKRALCAVVR